MGYPSVSSQVGSHNTWGSSTAIENEIHPTTGLTLAQAPIWFYYPNFLQYRESRTVLLQLPGKVEYLSLTFITHFNPQCPWEAPSQTSRMPKTPASSHCATMRKHDPGPLGAESKRQAHHRLSHRHGQRVRRRQ